MARKRKGPDAACYYGNKLMGRCTVADSDTYATLMEQCGGDAAHVLREYAYFSPELKEILEKVAAIQAQARGRGVVSQARPTASPWGEVQTCDTLCPGVFLVSTPGHGGTMVAKDMQAALSPAAKRCGQKFRDFLCFEEDCQESVVLRELLDKGLWEPTHIKDRAAYEEKLNTSIREYNPDYWRSRQAGLEKRGQAAERTPARTEQSTRQAASGQVGPKLAERKNDIGDFNIIYADPPWCYHNGGYGRAAAHYNLMRTKDICALPVGQLAAKDCALFMWATLPTLPDAFRVLEAWGFPYRTTAFVWVKPNKSGNGWQLGTGYWTRANAEICLLGIRGRPVRKSCSVRQLIIEPRREHSRKPDVARERIVELLGDIPRVELFARYPAPGWAVWGNEVDSTLDLTSGQVGPKPKGANTQWHM